MVFKAKIFLHMNTSVVAPPTKIHCIPMTIFVAFAQLELKMKFIFCFVSRCILCI